MGIALQDWWNQSDLLAAWLLLFVLCPSAATRFCCAPAGVRHYGSRHCACIAALASRCGRKPAPGRRPPGAAAPAGPWLVLVLSTQSAPRGLNQLIYKAH